MVTPSVGFDLVNAPLAPKIIFHGCCKLFLCALAPCQLGICTGPFLVADTKLPLCSWKSRPIGCQTC